MYVDYSYYKAKYCGHMTEEAFNAVIKHANAFVSNLTYQRIKSDAEATEDIKNAVCAVADVIGKHGEIEKQHAPGIASESVGKHSVSYAPEADLHSVRESEMMNAVDLFLPRSNPLRYSGV